MSATPYQQLEQEWRRLHAFRGALSLLRWDAAVMMPRGSAELRGEQVAALETEYHALLTTPKVTRLLDRAQADVRGLEDWQVSNLREMRRQRDHAIATPVTLISRLARATAMAESQWLAARRDNNFSLFAPHLQEVLLLVRDKAALLGQALNLPPYDALVDEFSPGVGTADIDAIFKALSRRLPAMIGEALDKQESQPVLPITGRFGTAKQRSLVVEVMKAVGFPFDQGRLDESEHPFTEGVVGDLRVTTRYDAADPFAGLLGALHETGHAMYDVGMPASWRDQPVGRDRGMALEESQSLLLEMIIGRSAPFLRYLQPLLQKHYGATGPEWEFDNLHRMLTRVRRSLIRVDADEMSYSLHIMQRYDIEKQLLAGKLAVRDLPEAWNSGMEQRFGARPTGTADGCLQDMHWALGHFGYFPSYALGLVIAAQLWEALRNQLPEVDTMIERGEFAPVFGWLRDNMHGFGAKLPIKELIKQASGQGLSANALLRYLQGKYLAESA
jgi:carboxypeptidase Taq